MPKSVKFALYGLVIVLVFLLVTLGSIALLIDPNAYKGQIASHIESQLDRPVHLKGKISWSVYPILGIKANNIAIDNPDGFGKKHMAEFSEFDIGIKTLPLVFSQRFDIDHLIAKNGQIWLLTNSSGKQNWQQVSSSKQGNQNQASSQNPTSDNNQSSEPTYQNQQHKLPPISYLHVENTNIDWSNKLTNQHYQLTNLDINIRNFKFHHSFDLAVNCNLSGTDMPVTHWQLKSKIHPQINGTNFSFDPFNITVKSVNGDSIGNMHGPFKLIIQDNGYKLDGNPNVDINPYNSANTFGVTALNRNFTQFSLNSHLEFVNNNLALYNVNGQINDQSYEGRLELRNMMAKPDLDFALHFRQLDLNNMLAQHVNNNKSKQGLPERNHHRSKASIQQNSKQTVKQRSNIYAPLEALHHLRGEITIDKLINKLRVNNLEATISNNHNNYHIKPLVAHLADGKITGDITAKRHQKTWTNQASFQLQSIASNKLLQQLRQKTWLTGDINGQGSISSYGTNVEDIIQNSRGSGHFKIANGKLIGFDLVDKTKQALQVIRMAGIATSLPNMNNVTPFTTLSTDFRLNYPLLSQNNILLDNDFLAISGKGAMNLDSKMINYDLKAVPKKKEIIIPISVMGRIDDIKVQPDVNSIMQQFLFGG